MKILYKTARYGALGYLIAFSFLMPSFSVGLFCWWAMMLIGAARYLDDTDSIFYDLNNNLNIALVYLGFFILVLDFIILSLADFSLAALFSMFVALPFYLIEAFIDTGPGLDSITHDITNSEDWVDHPAILGLICGVSYFYFKSKEERVYAAEEAEKRAEEERERKEKEAAAEKRRKKRAAAKRKKKIKELCDLHGEEFGESVYNNEVKVGMGEPAVLESWGKPKLSKDDKFYYPDKGLRKLKTISFTDGKVTDIIREGQPFHKGVEDTDIRKIWGRPGDTKKTVFKTKTKERWYYFPRRTRQKTTVYGYEVKFEDGLVVGWSELE